MWTCWTTVSAGSVYNIVLPPAQFLVCALWLGDWNHWASLLCQILTDAMRSWNFFHAWKYRFSSLLVSHLITFLIFPFVTLTNFYATCDFRFGWKWGSQRVFKSRTRGEEALPLLRKVVISTDTSYQPTHQPVSGRLQARPTLGHWDPGTNIPFPKKVGLRLVYRYWHCLLKNTRVVALRGRLYDLVTLILILYQLTAPSLWITVSSFLDSPRHVMPRHIL